jgi:hypothetical protein
MAYQHWTGNAGVEKPSGVEISTLCRQLAWAMQQIATSVGGQQEPATQAA